MVQLSRMNAASVTTPAAEHLTADVPPPDAGQCPWVHHGSTDTVSFKIDVPSRDQGDYTLRGGMLTTLQYSRFNDDAATKALLKSAETIVKIRR